MTGSLGYSGRIRIVTSSVEPLKLGEPSLTCVGCSLSVSTLSSGDGLIVALGGDATLSAGQSPLPLDLGKAVGLGFVGP